MSSTAPRPLIMGIINVTPDSFSGDGILTAADVQRAAILQAEQMITDGADILDIGGESTRPGYTPIGTEEEINRVIPVATAILRAFPSTHIAIDTTKAAVAAAALDIGAKTINDVTALRGDPEMASVIAHHKCQVVLMDNRSNPSWTTHNPKIGGHYEATNTPDIISDVVQNLEKRIHAATAAGIAKDKIILDPGIGFGKTVEQNLALIRHIAAFKQMGYPLLIAPSRKSFIGHVLETGVDERLEGTAATIALSAFMGADILRVHDVKFMSRVARMANAIATAR